MENCSSKYNFTPISDISESSSGSRWKTKELTYKISKYPSTNRLTKREVDSEIKKALNVWAEVTDLTFEQRLFGKVHICCLWILFCTVHFVIVYLMLTSCFAYCPYDVNILLCKVHIDIRFERRMHGDGDPFDGLGGTLAHAYFPVVVLFSHIPFQTYCS